MNKSLASIIAAAAVLSAPSVEAAAITGSGTFEAWYHDPEDQGPYSGLGFIEVRANRVVDFELTMLGVTWTEDDLTGTDVYVDTQYGPQLGSIFVFFANDEGSGHLSWSFTEQLAGIGIGVPPIFFSSTSDLYGGAFFTEQDFRVVPEPSALALFALGFAFLRRKASIRAE